MNEKNVKYSTSQQIPQRDSVDGSNKNICQSFQNQSISILSCSWNATTM